MIPAAARNISQDAIDLPGLWTQLKEFRADQRSEIPSLPPGSAPPVEVDDEADQKEIEWEESSEEEQKEEPDESLWIVAKGKKAPQNLQKVEQATASKTNPNALRAPYSHNIEDREKRYQAREAKRLQDVQKKEMETQDTSDEMLWLALAEFKQRRRRIKRQGYRRETHGRGRP